MSNKQTSNKQYQSEKERQETIKMPYKKRKHCFYAIHFVVCRNIFTLQFDEKKGNQ